MQKTFKKFFTGDMTFLTCILVGAFGLAFYSVVQLCFNLESPGSSFTRILRALMLVWLYDAYKKHEKNVMKGLMGALVMSQMTMAVSVVTSPLDGNFEAVFTWLFALLSAALFLNHFIINKSRYASPYHVFANQIFAILLGIETAVWTLATMPYTVSAIDIASELVDIIGNFGFYFSFVCVESRLDAYRIDREAAGWTEEKGYPEDYKRDR